MELLEFSTPNNLTKISRDLFQFYEKSAKQMTKITFHWYQVSHIENEYFMRQKKNYMKEITLKYDVWVSNGMSKNSRNNVAQWHFNFIPEK